MVIEKEWDTDSDIPQKCNKTHNFVLSRNIRDESQGYRNKKVIKGLRKIFSVGDIEVLQDTIKRNDTSFSRRSPG